MLAAIPYQTFPTIELGPLQLRTFGLMVGLAVLVGSWVAARHAEKFGVPRDDIYRLATWMVLAGVIGSRLTWDVTHWDEIDSPIDLIAVWEGGLQFSGGFIFAVLVGLPSFLKWEPLTRWRVLDGAAMGLAVGVFFGRIGCTAVGEHFGSETTFPLAVRWEGGNVPDVREPALGLDPGATPITEGLVFHHTAAYEGVAVLLLFGVLWLLNRRGVGVGTLSGVYLAAYAPLRFGFDALRVNDERVAGLTGAQWMCLAIVPIAAWILFFVRPKIRELELADASGRPADAASATTGTDTDPDATDAGVTDAGMTDATDAGVTDSGVTDADSNPDATDAGVTDADVDPGVIDAGRTDADVDPDVIDAGVTDADGGTASAGADDAGEPAVSAADPVGADDPTDDGPVRGAPPVSASGPVEPVDSPAPGDTIGDDRSTR